VISLCAPPRHQHLIYLPLLRITLHKQLTYLGLNYRTPAMPSSITRYIPAALLFSQKDVQHFIEWQKETHPSYLPGQVQDSIEYCEFLNDQRGNVAIAKLERSKALAQNKNPAKKCGHGLHPSDIIMTSYSPVCEVEMCLTFLEALAKIFQKCGGPWPQDMIKREYLLVR
jgi:hypothetical protein